MLRIAERNAAQDEKRSADMLRIAERNAAQDEKRSADMLRIAERNAAQDEKLAEQKETQVRILAILEQHGRELKRLEEQNEKALTRLENKVDKMDEFLRGGKKSASLDEEGPTQNVSASLCLHKAPQAQR